MNLTKEQIKNAPDYEEARSWDEAYKQELGDYYGDAVTPPPPDVVRP